MARRSDTKDARPRVLRKDRTGANPVTVALIALIVTMGGCWAAFRQDNPLSTPYQLQAVFQDANGLRPGMPVRIAGVDVGSVAKVDQQPGTQAARVTMEVHERGLPIHKDAELKIRPRIFLEGSYFVELRPGTPAQPSLSSGDTVPVTQTATPVQLDQILTTLQTSTRDDLKSVLQGFGGALTSKPTAADDRSQDRAVRGKTGAQALNQSLGDAPDAVRGAAVVNSALVGTSGDVAATIKGLARVNRSLGADTGALKGLIENLNTTTTALASERAALRETIGDLPATLKTTNAAFDALNAAFPPLRAFSVEILPGVGQTQATVDAARPWVAQATKLFSQDELGGLTKTLRPATRDLASSGASTRTLLAEQDLLSQCATKVLLPAGNVVIDDGNRGTGVEAYKSFFYAAVGFAGEAQNFDGNGPWLRGTVGGDVQLRIAGTRDTGGRDLYGSAPGGAPRGTRPAMPKALPPQNFRAPCKDQKVPDLNGAKVGAADGQGLEPGGLLGFGGTDKENGSTKALAAALLESASPLREAAKR